ncbi:MAG: glycosyltransferase family 4 protein [Vicinamibacterales bacterium]
MNVLLVTDSFPPVCGGSGWSTYELAAGLRRRGHAVVVVKITAGGSGRDGTTEYDGLPVIECHFYAPSVPGIRNYFKNERLYARLTPRLEQLIAEHRIDLVHGQHVLSTPPAIAAARRAGIPSVATVRDYWPVCYRSDLIHSRQTRVLCPGCAQAAAVQHGRPSLGAFGLATQLVRNYLRANLRRKQEALVSADAVIAVSSRISADLQTRIPDLSPSRLHLIPNPVDTEAVLRRAATERPLASPYALYAGKLAPNKGTSYLPEVVTRAQLDWPLVIVGDGPDRASLERAANASGHQVRFTGWQDPSQTATWMAHAAMLIFPSQGPESLSRVLIEASALGVPIAAMNTGGTTDIIKDEVSGLLSNTADELATDVTRLRNDAGLRRRLGQAAVEHARATFDAASVVARIETLYATLVTAAKGPR